MRCIGSWLIKNTYYTFQQQQHLQLTNHACLIRPTCMHESNLSNKGSLTENRTTRLEMRASSAWKIAPRIYGDVCWYKKNDKRINVFMPCTVIYGIIPPANWKIFQARNILSSNCDAAINTFWHNQAPCSVTIFPLIIEQPQSHAERRRRIYVLGPGALTQFLLHFSIGCDAIIAHFNLYGPQFNYILQCWEEVWGHVY